MWLLAFFVIIPIIEIALFIQVGGIIGLWPTLGIVLLTAIAGTSLMRSQGAHAWLEVQRSFAEMRDPSRPLAHGVMILIAGMLLLTPGFFTDTLGVLLLIPGVRNVVMRQIAKRVHVTRVGGERPKETHRPPYNDGVIDGDYTVDDEPSHKKPVPPDMESLENPPKGNSGWTRH